MTSYAVTWPTDPVSDLGPTTGRDSPAVAVHGALPPTRAVHGTAYRQQASQTVRHEMLKAAIASLTRCTYASLARGTRIARLMVAYLVVPARGFTLHPSQVSMAPNSRQTRLR